MAKLVTDAIGPPGGKGPHVVKLGPRKRMQAQYNFLSTYGVHRRGGSAHIVYPGGLAGGGGEQRSAPPISVQPGGVGGGHGRLRGGLFCGAACKPRGSTRVSGLFATYWNRLTPLGKRVPNLSSLSHRARSASYARYRVSISLFVLVHL